MLALSTSGLMENNFSAVSVYFLGKLVTGLPRVDTSRRWTPCGQAPVRLALGHS
jgi:hypothetical protein